MNRIRSKLSYANVMATIAVFLVLGGGAAVAAGGLAKNSVGAKQLKRNAVTTAKIKNGAVTGAKINPATLPAVPTATNANSANNANSLGGVPAGSYQQKPMWALVNGDGTILDQSGGISLEEKTPSGGYWLRFPQSLAGKAISVTPWAGWEGLDPSVQAGYCGGNDGKGGFSCSGSNTSSVLWVETQEEAGDGEEVAFYAVVFP